MWVDAQRDGRQAEYRWRPLRKFRSIPCISPQSLDDGTCWTAGVLCSNAGNVEERKSWTQSEFCSWQEPKNVYIVYQPRRWPNIVQFCSPPLSDVGAVTKPRRETG